jgi:hypothetical protein
MAGPVYPGPKRMPGDARRLIGGCDPQARDKPLSVDLLCAFAAIPRRRCAIAFVLHKRSFLPRLPLGSRPEARRTATQSRGRSNI